MKVTEEIEEICGRELTLDEFKSTITKVIPFISSKKVRVLVYNVEPPGKTFCVVNDIAISYSGDVLLKMTCVDETGSTYNTTSIAMDYFKYSFVITRKMREEMKTSKPVRELNRIMERILRADGIKRKIVKVYLYLTKDGVTLNTNLDTSVSNPLIEWFKKWVLTGGYTPVLLFELLVDVLRDKSITVVPHLANLDNDFIINLLY